MQRFHAQLDIQKIQQEKTIKENEKVKSYERIDVVFDENDDELQRRANSFANDMQRKR